MKHPDLTNTSKIGMYKYKEGFIFEVGDILIHTLPDNTSIIRSVKTEFTATGDFKNDSQYLKYYDETDNPSSEQSLITYAKVISLLKELSIKPNINKAGKVPESFNIDMITYPSHFKLEANTTGNISLQEGLLRTSQGNNFLIQEIITQDKFLYRRGRELHSGFSWDPWTSQDMTARNILIRELQSSIDSYKLMEANLKNIKDNLSKSYIYKPSTLDYTPNKITINENRLLVITAQKDGMIYKFTIDFDKDDTVGFKYNKYMKKVTDGIDVSEIEVIKAKAYKL